MTQIDDCKRKIADSERFLRMLDAGKIDDLRDHYAQIILMNKTSLSFWEKIDAPCEVCKGSGRK